MNPNELLKKARGLRRNITAPGSPFRYLRKGFLNLSRPIDTLRRVTRASAVTRSFPTELQSKLDTLNEKGYADALTELDPALLAELDTYCQGKLAQNPDLQSRMIAYWANLTTPEDKTIDGILVRFALQEPVLKLAAAYFGQVPYLADVDISVSFSTGKPAYETSQLWHRDYADHRTIKLWVYLTDVNTPEDGPLTYVEPGPSAKIKNTFFPGRVKDETIAECLEPGEVKQIFGKRGSAFYIDTRACYHCGSRLATGHRRVTYVATFLTRNSLFPCDNGINGINGTGQLSEVEKLVLGI
ncbi:MAG: hypothetical protein ABJF10_01385 [Chthoniobacter sp.]|uniref:hypothetical protein n=1 Tax=Chthoniobacter sp. TaxID=2510640 RepID=UPI0032A6CAE9